MRRSASDQVARTWRTSREKSLAIRSTSRTSATFPPISRAAGGTRTTVGPRTDRTDAGSAAATPSPSA